MQEDLCFRIGKKAFYLGERSFGMLHEKGDSLVKLPEQKRDKG